MWLEALQAAIVLRRQGASAVTKSSRKQKAKSTSTGSSAPVAGLISVDQVKDKKSGSHRQLFRFSLDFIPGQGKKYPSIDGSQFQDASQKENLADADQKNKKRHRSSKSANPRPISQSLSSFILLNTSSADKLDDGSDDQILRKTATASPSATRRPRIPTSFGVGKLLSHMKSDVGSKSSFNESAKSLDSVDVDEAKVIPLKYSSSENMADDKQPKEPAAVVVTKEQVVSPTAVEPTEKKEPKKDAPRRKSSFNMIKEFFIRAPSKVFKRSATKEGDPGDAEATVPAVKEDVEAKQPQCDPSSTDALEKKNKHQKENLIDVNDKDDTKDKKYLPQISEMSVTTVQEEPVVAESAFECEAKVLEVVEPEEPLHHPQEEIVEVHQGKDSSSSSSSSGPDLGDMEVITIADVEPKRNSGHVEPENVNPMPEIVLMDSSNELCPFGEIDIDHFSLESTDAAEGKPQLPVKTKIKCPSPEYDTPRNNSPIFIPELAIQEPSGNQEVECCPLPTAPVEIDPVQDDDKSSAPQQDVEDHGIKGNESPPPPLEPQSKSPETKSRGLAHLVQFFTASSSSSVQLEVPVARRKSAGKAEEVKRISFALADTETFKEESVQELPDELK